MAAPKLSGSEHTRQITESEERAPFSWSARGFHTIEKAFAKLSEVSKLNISLYSLSKGEKSSTCNPVSVALYSAKSVDYGSLSMRMTLFTSN
jgi:hypothetical protein